MHNSVQTLLNVGTTGVLVDTECQLSNGLPAIIIVGLGNKAIEEAKERVRSAFASSKIPMPRKRITINLAPADVPKESTSFDLAIAIAILQADGQIKQPVGRSSAVIGELGLDGSVRSVRGIIGKLLAGKQHNIKRFFIPYDNLAQAKLVPDIEIVPIKTLIEFCAGLNSSINFSDTTIDSGKIIVEPTVLQAGHALSEIVGQERAKRGLEIAAAGGHNILFNGPPGTGKSMLARALPSILPPLNTEEMLEITQLHSLVSGQYDRLITDRPFRTPHHSASHVAIVGGGNNLRPGEVSLAHRGVLFLDEFPEFGRSTIEALRQPLEDRVITVARAKDSALYPANFILAATANPCPCGYFGTSKPCSCSAHTILRYRQKLSGPIIDRIDLYADVQEVDHASLLAIREESNDEAVMQRVAKARSLQAQRYASRTKLNADMTNRDIKNKSNISSAAEEILNQAATALGLSPRSYMRVIKVARTIADLSDSPKLEQNHVTEALQYRTPNKQPLD